MTVYLVKRGKKWFTDKVMDGRGRMEQMKQM